MTDKMLAVRALQVLQDGKTPLYSFFLRSDQILTVADISRIKRGEDDTVEGFQREVVRSHVREISEYLKSGKVLFPNALILAISNEVRFTKSRGPKVGDAACHPGILEIPIKPEGQRVAWIVDGQQRTMALSEAGIDPMLVPVTGFVSDDFEVHRVQFMLVNKAKPLPKGLINELLPEVNTAHLGSISKNKIPSTLCNILNKDPASPFKEMIIRETTDRKTNKVAVIRDNSLIQVISRSLKNVNGCFYQYTNVATGQIDVEPIRIIMNLYWNAVKKTFPDAWGKPPQKSRLMGGVGIQAMGNLMDRMMANVRPSDSKVEDKVLESLASIKPHCAWTKGTWDKLNGIPWNHLQNTPKDINMLSNMLIRVYNGIE